MRLVSFVGALLLVGCGGSTPEAPGGSGAPQADVSAGSDLLSDQGALSDAVMDGGADGETASSLGCESQEECPADTLCACDGSCVVDTQTPCVEAKNCGSGTWCNPCSGQCEATVALCEPCSAGGECGLDGACVPLSSGGSVCGMNCLSDAGCTAGYSCVSVAGLTSAQCVPESGDCVALGLCEDSGDCADGQKCLQKECVDGCSEDGSCPSGTVCVAAECTAPCLSDADCDAPATCDEDGHCRAPGWCEDGGDCTAEEHCDKVSHACEPGCLADTDCQDASLICEAELCVPKGCQHNYQCAFAEECLQDFGQCVPTADPHCGPCDASQEDNSLACGSEGALCASLNDKDDNPQGDFCFLECADDPIDQCPQGYGCTHIEAPDAGIDGWYCTRECFVQPF